jgi:hypothetical protein
MPEPQPRPLERIADGLAGVTRGFTTDLAATFFNVAYGSGHAVPPPYVISHSSDAQEQGLSDLVGGTLDALRATLTQDPLDALRQELNGHEPSLDRDRSHGR